MNTGHKEKNRIRILPRGRWEKKRIPRKSTRGKIHVLETKYRNILNLDKKRQFLSSFRKEQGGEFSESNLRLLLDKLPVERLERFLRQKKTKKLEKTE